MANTDLDAQERERFARTAAPKPKPQPVDYQPQGKQAKASEPQAHVPYKRLHELSQSVYGVGRIVSALGIMGAIGCVAALATTQNPSWIAGIISDVGLWGIGLLMQLAGATAQAVRDVAVKNA